MYVGNVTLSMIIVDVAHEKLQSVHDKNNVAYYCNRYSKKGI